MVYSHTKLNCSNGIGIRRRLRGVSLSQRNWSNRIRWNCRWRSSLTVRYGLNL
ncbi:Uncharacterized protein APZ42_005581 [Daphnia magna]|uniref:Uncharacterized protein n=1 Tax=Daphnia magna TaxID=35525 RepID=A0A164GDB9_9CRUS|nr:Uncharacterized protein APZ42_005581 [Daphnia magna]